MAANPKQLLAISERGNRIGQGHPNAMLADHDVELILMLREEGLTLSAIAKKFDVGKAATFKIGTGLRRAETPARWVVANEKVPRSLRAELRAKAKEHPPLPPQPVNEAVLELQQALSTTWR